ncbi:MAG: CYTH domain-containing protein [Patescibacteria group bacterium]
METEIEAKFLDVDPNQLRQLLKKLGAKLIHKERLMRRQTFDLLDLLLKNKGGWVRVRDEGDKITLSYKQEKDRTLYGIRELTVEVSDFDLTCELLETIGLVKKGYQETKRETWILDECEVTIDTWPWIPTTVEVEGSTEKLVRQVSGKLALDWSHVLHGSVSIAYQKYFKVTDDEINEYPTITFGPVPDWLEKKRIKK